MPLKHGLLQSDGMLMFAASGDGDGGTDGGCGRLMFAASGEGGGGGIVHPWQSDELERPQYPHQDGHNGDGGTDGGCGMLMLAASGDGDGGTDGGCGRLMLSKAHRHPEQSHPQLTIVSHVKPDAAQ